MNTRSLSLCALLMAAALPAAGTRAQQIIVDRKQAQAPLPAKRVGSESKLSPTPSTPPTSVLHWNNGESVTGEPVGATNDSLLWKSPFFDDPLELAWTTLHRVDKELPDSVPEDSFAFVLRDGSRVYGELTAVTATTVSIRSARHGDAVLRRSEVIGAWRLKGQGIVYAGPLGESGWTAAPNIRLDSENTTQVETLGKVATRLTGPGGSLVLPFWHRTLTNPVALPDRAEIEFDIHAKDQPAFQLVLDGRDKKRLRVETWGNEVVLATAKDFRKICQLGANTRRVELRVCWDRPARQCQVYGRDGALLAEWTLPEGSEGVNKPAVSLMNKGRELTLDVLRVREWDGRPPAAVDVEHPRVILNGGRAVAGGVSSLEGAGLTIETPEGSPAVHVALDEVDMIAFSPGAPAGASRETTLSCADGTLLHGQINGFQEGRALLKTAFTDAPLPVKIDDMRQLFVLAPAPPGAPPETPLESLDRIVVQGTTLHGRMVAATDGAGPRWLPVGGKNAVAPTTAIVSEMTRVFPSGSQGPAATSLLYTRMGDALPGALHGLDRQQVEFDSPWIENKNLPLDQLQAIQFDAAGKGPITGFDAAGWESLKGNKSTPREKDDTLKLAPNVVVGHPAAAQEGDIRFNYDTDSYSCLRLRLFCEGANTARSLNYLIMRSGNRFSTGVESPEGQFSSQTQSASLSGPVTVRLVIDEKAVRCYLNNALAEVIWYPASRRGAGLVLAASSVWGNPVQDVALSKFSATSPSGRSFLLGVSADAKTQALTVPRFRRDDPPRHALLANNGDVLRGEIVALTNTQIGFRIGLETLRIPRERVAAMIALQPPVADAPAADEPDAMQKLLERRLGLRTTYGNVGYASLLGVLRQAVPELKFQPPSGPDTRRVQFHFADQSVAEALDSICEQFELRYHVDKGVIVLEARAPRESTNMVRKAYWLKGNPFAGRGSAAEVLASRDVPFPKGAGAEWQENAQCLEITNTAANQEKIAGLLDREFGGTLGSPTHWLLLRNGGRIGLVVEKFEPDFVRGTHPVYGRCKIPLAEVYAVRNTLPEQTAAARAVNGWRMVYAPEPVLPQGGGENSEMLGKDAPTFKLKTLDGGDFDLARQRGSIVVLDFWATWCGPCIKSLPGLMEAMRQFPADKVKLVGVNQAEAPEQVKRFLESHKWQLAVAMDAGQTVGRQYGVDGIPHTVIIAPDGKVAWVHTGAAPDADAQASEVVKKLLGGLAEPPRHLPKADTVMNGPAGREAARP